MRHESFRLAPLGEKRRFLLIVCAFSLLCFSQGAFAQSGRRQSKSVSTTPPVIVEPKTEAEVKPPKAKPAPIATLIIGGDNLSSSFDIPSGYLDIAINACIDRLEKSQSLAVSSAGSNMRKKDAIDKAKKQTEAYVVWLEIRGESDGSGLILEYFVFTPQTAKVKSSGHVYLDRIQRGNGRIGVGLPPSVSGKLPLDYMMKEGGRNVADRLVEVFSR